MVNMNEVKIIQTTALLDKYNKEYCAYDNLQINLRESDDVKEYLRCIAEKEKYKKLISDEVKKTQQQCVHKINIFNSENYDGYEGRYYWTVTCLSCDKHYEDRSKNIKNVLFIRDDVKNNDVINKYLELSRLITDESAILNELINKFCK